MSPAQMNHIGFADPRRRHDRRRSTALVQLIATVALALSITVVVTAVSIGLVHAHASSTMPGAPTAMRLGVQHATLPTTSVSAMAVPHMSHLRPGRAAL